MQVGIFAKTFKAPDLEGILQQVVNNGFETIQFNMSCVGLDPLPAAYPDNLLQNTGDTIASYQLTVSAVSGTFNMAHPGREERQNGLDRLCLLVENVFQLNTRIITLCTGSRDSENMWRDHPGNKSKEAWRDLCATLEPALAKAEAHDVILAIEPELNNVVYSAEKGLELVHEMRSEYLKVVFDPANLFEKADPRDALNKIKKALELLYEYTVMFHAKDRLEDGRFVPAGKGIIPFPYLAAYLKENHFRGNIIAHELKAGESRECYDYLKSIFCF